MGTVHHHHENHEHDQHEGNAGRFGRPFGRGFRPGGPGFGFGPGAGFGPGGPGFGFGPGRGGRGRARKGDVRLAILSLLADAPSNGYGLIKSIAERTDGVWKPSPGSVYPTLQQLVDEDLVSSDDTGAKTVFALTEAGRAFVTENGDAIAKAWAASTEGADDHDEFTTSVMKLVGVVKQFRFDGTEAQRAAAVEKLDETRRALYAILAD